ncbi:MAG: hypothetical protein K2Q18_19180, partial [Bdellovibrionales bacterium]|nr:hypothetical protein [Bdellovibrionales bacterium]
YACLKKDFCGMETRSEDDAYFDDQRTPAHILINRHLQVMKESLRKDPTLAAEVDWKLLEEMASANSEMLSSLALEIMGEFDGETMKTKDLLTLTEDAKGETKANSLLQISKKASGADKALIASKVGNVFESDDPNTVISVLEKMKKMALYSVQLPDVLKNLCHFKSENDHNWLMIKYEANKVYSQFESVCN